VGTPLRIVEQQGVAADAALRYGAVMTLRILSSLLLGLAAALFPGTTFAVKPHRCNGMVQFRPCDGEAAALPPRAAAPETPRPAQRRPAAPPWYARVVSSNFQRLASGDGVWRGKVEGNGLIELELQIVRRGNLESSRRLGRVRLSNKSSSFVLKTPVPHGNDWSWTLVAHAAPPQDIS
jgi:hypothetical protein